MKKFIPQLINYSHYNDPSKRPDPIPQCDGCERFFHSWEDLEETLEGEYLCDECFKIYQEEK